MTLLKNDFLIPVSINKLTELKITIEDFVFMYLLEQDERFVLDTYFDSVNKDYLTVVRRLIKTGYVEKINDKSPYISLSNVKVTPIYLKMFVNGNSDENVEDWIDEWYALWPSGIKSGGYYLRTDKFGAKRKMKKFFKKYPNYTKDLIMDATKSYLLEQSIKGYSYTKLAPYFIEKDGLSVLSGECENLLETGEVSQGTKAIEVYGEKEL